MLFLKCYFVVVVCGVIFWISPSSHASEEDLPIFAIENSQKQIIGTCFAIESDPVVFVTAAHVVYEATRDHSAADSPNDNSAITVNVRFPKNDFRKAGSKIFGNDLFDRVPLVVVGAGYPVDSKNQHEKNRTTDRDFALLAFLREGDIDKYFAKTGGAGTLYELSGKNLFRPVILPTSFSREGKVTFAGFVKPNPDVVPAVYRELKSTDGTMRELKFDPQNLNILIHSKFAATGVSGGPLFDPASRITFGITISKDRSDRSSSRFVSFAKILAPDGILLRYLHLYSYEKITQDLLFRGKARRKLDVEIRKLTYPDFYKLFYYFHDGDPYPFRYGEMGGVSVVSRDSLKYLNSALRKKFNQSNFILDDDDWAYFKPMRKDSIIKERILDFNGSKNFEEQLTALVAILELDASGEVPALRNRRRLLSQTRTNLLDSTSIPTSLPDLKSDRIRYDPRFDLLLSDEKRKLKINEQGEVFVILNNSPVVVGAMIPYMEYQFSHLIRMYSGRDLVIDSEGGAWSFKSSSSEAAGGWYRVGEIKSNR